MFKLARFLKPYKKQVIAGPIFKLIEAVFELIVPLVMANIIDIGVKNNDGPYIWRMGGLLLLLGVVGLCSTLVCQYFAPSLPGIRHGAAEQAVSPHQYLLLRRGG